MISAETDCGDVIPERGELLSGVSDAMCDLPVKINYLPVKLHERQRSPGGRPIEITKGWCKLVYTMRPARIDGKAQLVARLEGKRRHLKTNIVG